MKAWKRDLGPGRRLVAMFLAVAVLLTGTLLWLGWQLARQDRQLATSRLQERQEIAADLAVAALQKSLAQAEGQLAALAALPALELSEKAAAAAASLPADSVLVLVRGAAVESYPEKRLPFYPGVNASSAPADSLFAAAEALEFRTPDYPKALAALGKLASSGRPEVQAAAFLRMARIRRKQGQWEEALATYRDLSALKGVEVEGLPAELVARGGRLDIFEQQQRSDAAHAEAGALLNGLRQRRWRLTRGAYDFYDGAARRILGITASDADATGQIALAGAVESLCGGWSREDGRFGRRILSEDGRGTLALWRGFDGKVAALVLGTRWLEAQWAPALLSISASQGVAVGLTDAEGSAMFGPEAARSPRSTVRVASATQLPWNLHILAVSPEAALASSETRERWLFAGMAAVALLTLAGAYLVGRAVSRELAVSRQQSDFVSAVSHEFRTPLTSLCLLTEQLASGRISGEKDRGGYYEVLMSESRRLRRLVEGLLNFGRMEAGTAEYRFETIDPAEAGAGGGPPTGAGFRNRRPPHRSARQ